MAKKNFTGGFNKLLGETPKGQEPAKPTTKEKKKRGRPKDHSKRVPEKSSQEGTKNDETRATFIVKEEMLAQLKNIAYWDRALIKEVVNEALSDFIKNWEAKHGKAKPIPKKKKS